MVTKQLRADHLNTRYDVVDVVAGRKTRRPIVEYACNPRVVELVVKVGETFEHRSFDRRDRVRVAEAER